jgi:diguanylate cyclase (GGDEF)-like protein
MNRGNRFYRKVLDQGDAAVLVIDGEDLAIRWASRAARRLFGKAQGPFTALVATEDAATVGTFLQAVAVRDGGASRCGCRVPVKGSIPRHVDLIVRNLTADPDVAGLVVVAMGVTSWAVRANRLLDHLNIDTKTGLANWNSFIPQLEQAARGAPASGSGPILISLDIDHFKMINDRYGHHVGDEVLRRTASAITSTVGERGTAARTGGEEFAVLLDRASEEEALDTAHDVLAAIKVPITLAQGIVVRVTASGGITAVRPGRTADALLRQADIAMYRAKVVGRDTVVAYNDDLADWMLARKNLTDHLAERLEQLHQENQALTEAATVDRRTGLLNSTVFETDHARLHQSGSRYSLLLIDIDYFHSYNETYGYLAGHETLRTVGQIISASVRAGDETYRYGGEEFAVILPGARLHDAATIGDRVRQAVEQHDIEHRGSPSGVLTVCVGAVEVDAGATLTRTLEEASLAVFAGKDAGRNRVIARVARATPPAAG